jgi:mannose-6-phosphate isomerase-like protein (cupin superfamily)
MMEIFFEHVNRKWGSFDVLAKDSQTLVKVMKILPGECISLQRHKFRDQLYYIISPINIQFGAHPKNLTNIEVQHSGKTFFFPRGMWHRAINPERGSTAFYVEVSFGHYDESDIERADDKYGRHIGVPSL